MRALLLEVRWGGWRFGCGHAGQDLPACGYCWCVEPGVGDAAGLRLAVAVLVLPGGGEPVVGDDEVAGCVAGCGPERVGPEVQALCRVLIDPVSDVVFVEWGGADERPADEIRVPQRSIA